MSNINGNLLGLKGYAKNCIPIFQLMQKYS